MKGPGQIMREIQPTLKMLVRDDAPLVVVDPAVRRLSKQCRETRSPHGLRNGPQPRDAAALLVRSGTYDIERWR